MTLFERFTDGARRVVVLAQEEARLLGHNYIGTEHLLLGLMHEGSGEAARALAGAGLTLDRVREQVLALVPVSEERPNPSGHIPFTPRAKTVMELALREALRLRHRYLGTEHLLLGLLQEGKGVAVGALRGLGADPAELRRAVLAELGEPGQTPPAGEHLGEHTPADYRTHVLAEMRATFDDNERLRGEVARLRALLLRHDIDPDEAAEQGQSGSTPA